VGAEALIAVGVLAVTAGLVNAVPGETAGGGGAFTAEIHGNDVLVDATVEPARPGPVDIDIATETHGGEPIQPEEVEVTLRLPERELGPLTVALTEDGTGRYHSTGAELPFPGTWELQITVRTSDIDQDRLTTQFDAR
jgi:copper transport protein